MERSWVDAVWYLEGVGLTGKVGKTHKGQF
jgi:hypothetical protein